MTKYYRDFYGAVAEVSSTVDGDCKVAVYGGCAMTLLFAKTYKTFRGAKIGLGRYSDAWHEISKGSYNSAKG